MADTKPRPNFSSHLAFLRFSVRGYPDYFFHRPKEVQIDRNNRTWTYEGHIYPIGRARPLLTPGEYKKQAVIGVYHCYNGRPPLQIFLDIEKVLDMPDVLADTSLRNPIPEYDPSIKFPPTVRTRP